MFNRHVTICYSYLSSNENFEFPSVLLNSWLPQSLIFSYFLLFVLQWVPKLRCLQLFICPNLGHNSVTILPLSDLFYLICLTFWKTRLHHPGQICNYFLYLQCLCFCNNVITNFYKSKLNTWSLLLQLLQFKYFHNNKLQVNPNKNCKPIKKKLNMYFNIYVNFLFYSIFYKFLIFNF